MTRMKWTNFARQPSTTGNPEMKITTTLESYRITYKQPIPTSSVFNSRTRYPFQYMSVGHSFIVPHNKETTVRSASYAYGKRHDMQFTCRNQPDGTRVWRIR